MTLPVETLMYMVYWTIPDENGGDAAHGQAFASSEMGAAMHFMEQLRIRQRAGEAIRFITMSSENPHLVGHAGVAETGPDYQWKKRRR